MRSPAESYLHENAKISDLCCYQLNSCSGPVMGLHQLLLALQQMDLLVPTCKKKCDYYEAFLVV
jgi:hypothetical protein